MTNKKFVTFSYYDRGAARFGNCPPASRCIKKKGHKAFQGSQKVSKNFLGKGETDVKANIRQSSVGCCEIRRVSTWWGQQGSADTPKGVPPAGLTRAPRPSRFVPMRRVSSGGGPPASRCIKKKGHKAFQGSQKVSKNFLGKGETDVKANIRQSSVGCCEIRRVSTWWGQQGSNL